MNINQLFIIWKEGGIVTEAISRTDEGQNPDRNIFSKNVDLTSTSFYSTEVWSITTEF